MNGPVFSGLFAYWITGIILALDTPLSVNRIVLRALLRKLFKWKLCLGLFVVGKLYRLSARLLQGRTVALSGYFTFQYSQRHQWFCNDSTPLKRSEPFHCIPVHSRLRERQEAHQSLWLRTGRPLAASVRLLGCQQPRIWLFCCALWWQHCLQSPLLFGQSAGYWCAVVFLQCSWELAHQSVPQPQWCARACWAPPAHCLQQSILPRKL